MKKTLFVSTLCVALHIAGCGSVSDQECPAVDLAADVVTVESDCQLEQLAGKAEIDGNLLLSGVTSLEPLRDLKRVGTLFIEEAELLRNLHGLEKLETVERDLILSLNEHNEVMGLSDLSGLESLTTLEGRLMIFEDGTRPFSLEGLENLVSVGGLWIESRNIRDMRGLENLTTVDSIFLLYGDNGGETGDQLLSLQGLERLKAVGGNLWLISLHGLSSLNGLSALTSVGGELLLSDVDAISNLDGLDGLASVGEGLDITYNDELIEFSGLDKLQSVGGDMNIESNLKLKRMVGLQELTAIGGRVFVKNNPSLSSCLVDEWATLGGFTIVGQDNGSCD